MTDVAIKSDYTVALTSDQADLLNDLAFESGVTRSQIVEDALREHLREFEIQLPAWSERKPKTWHGKANPAKAGKIIGKFSFSGEQAQAINAALSVAGGSFASFFETAMAKYVPGWPKNEHYDIPWGRPREA